MPKSDATSPGMRDHAETHADADVPGGTGTDELLEESIELNKLETKVFDDQRKLHWNNALVESYTARAAYYERRVALGAGHNRGHHILAVGDYVFVTLWGSSELMRAPRDTMAPAYLALGYQPYHLCYDGTTLWVVGITSISRINPTTFAIIDTTALPVAYSPATWVCYAAGYIWVGMLNHVVRVDPTNPATQTDIHVHHTQCRGIVYDGTYLWTANNAFITRITPSTLAMVDYAVAFPGGDNEIFSIEWDGNHIWASGPDTPADAYLLKLNPQSGGFRTYDLSVLAGAWAGLTINWVHMMWFDGKYLYLGLELTPGKILALNTDTMEITVRVDNIGSLIHGLCYDGVYLWYCNDDTPAGFGRFIPRPANRAVWTGLTATFSTAAIGQQQVAISWSGNLIAAPWVMVGIQDISDQTCEIDNVCALNVGAAGFTCSCYVRTAGAGGSTARFSWIVVNPNPVNIP